MNSVLSSNANSALSMTLMNSESKVNPQEYSLNKIYPFHSQQLVSIPPLNSSSTYSQGTTLNYDLNKYGIAKGIVLHLKATFTQGHTAHATNNLPNFHTLQTAMINAIDEVELLSSSRSISKMDRASILASFRDMPADVRQSFTEAIEANAQPTPTAIVGSREMFLPLVFPIFASASTFPNLTFQEPMRLVVRLSNAPISADRNAHADVNGSMVASNVSFSKADVIVSYINYDAKTEDELLNENYGDASGQLSLLTYEYESENPDVKDYDANQTLEVELKQTSVVSDIYFYVCVPASDLTGTYTANYYNLGEVPLELDNVKLVASGQTILDVPAKYLKLWGCPSDENFFGAGVVGETAGIDKSGIDRVYKIQFGQSISKAFASNGISLRELNNVKLTCSVKQNGTAGGGAVQLKDGTAAKGKLELRVINRSHSIITIDANNGRVQKNINN